MGNKRGRKVGKFQKAKVVAARTNTALADLKFRRGRERPAPGELLKKRNKEKP